MRANRHPDHSRRPFEPARSSTATNEHLARQRLDDLVAELAGHPTRPPLLDPPPAGPDSDQGRSLGGRHAYPRLPVGSRWGGWLEDRLPEPVRARVRLGPGQVGVILLVLACGVLLAAWTTARGAEHVAPAAAPVVSTPTTDLASPALGAPTDGPVAGQSGSVANDAAGGVVEVVVDVQGRVRRPGIVTLPSGSRVIDAVKAAGGYVGRRAGMSAVNLARPLVDGEQVILGRPAVAAAGSLLASSTGPAVPGAPQQLVSLNTADQTTLETLPGVGPVTATSIITWREENGGFTSIDQLIDVSGIGEKTLAELAPLVTL